MSRARTASESDKTSSSSTGPLPATGSLETTADTSSFLAEVRSALLKNSARTLRSEAEALLQHTFAGEWDEQTALDGTEGMLQQQHLPAEAVATPVGPLEEDLDFNMGENTLDWVSSLYNKLPTSETGVVSFGDLSEDGFFTTTGGTTPPGYYEQQPTLTTTDPDYQKGWFFFNDANANNSDGEQGGETRAQLICAQCGFVASNRKQLWRHGKRENHLTRPAFDKAAVPQNRTIRERVLHACQYCSYTSKSRFNVERHCIRVHINEKCQTCDNCGKHFKDLDTLRTHVRYTHMNERRHMCDLCDKQFVSSSDLLRHRRIVHDKIRDFVCQKCGKRFQTSTNAKRHFIEVCAPRESFSLNEQNFVMSSSAPTMVQTTSQTYIKSEPVPVFLASELDSGMTIVEFGAGGSQLQGQPSAQNLYMQLQLPSSTAPTTMTTSSKYRPL